MKYVISLVALLVLSGCTEARRAKLMAYGDEAEIVQFSGGQETGRWCSTGKVSNSDNSDGVFFRDKKTGKLLEVSGTVQIIYASDACD